MKKMRVTMERVLWDAAEAKAKRLNVPVDENVMNLARRECIGASLKPLGMVQLQPRLLEEVDKVLEEESIPCTREFFVTSAVSQLAKDCRREDIAAVVRLEWRNSRPKPKHKPRTMAEHELGVHA